MVKVNLTVRLTKAIIVSAIMAVVMAFPNECLLQSPLIGTPVANSTNVSNYNAVKDINSALSINFVKLCWQISDRRLLMIDANFNDIPLTIGSKVEENDLVGTNATNATAFC